MFCDPTSQAQGKLAHSLQSFYGKPLLLPFTSSVYYCLLHHSHNKKTGAVIGTSFPLTTTDNKTEREGAVISLLLSTIYYPKPQELWHITILLHHLTSFLKAARPSCSPPPTTTSVIGMGPVHIAAENGDLEEIMMLVKRDPQVRW